MDPTRRMARLESPGGETYSTAVARLLHMKLTANDASGHADDYKASPAPSQVHDPGTPLAQAVRST